MRRFCKFTNISYTNPYSNSLKSLKTVEAETKEESRTAAGRGRERRRQLPLCLKSLG